MKIIPRNRTENLVEKVKNDVFEEYESGEKEEAGNCNILPNTYAGFSVLLPTENASYYSPILYSLMSFIQDTFSSRDPWGVSRRSCITSSPNIFAKRKTWVRSRCKWQVRTTEPDRFGHLNEIIFPERNHSEAKKKVRPCCLICNQVYCPKLPHWLGLCTVLAAQKLKAEKPVSPLDTTLLLECPNLWYEQTQSDTSIVGNFSSRWHAV